MEFLKNLSLVLAIPPVVTLLYDLIDNWFVKATFELDKLEVWWKKISPDSMAHGRNIISSMTSPAIAAKLFHMPACFALAIPPLFFYLLYRIIFLLQGGKTGGYKSRH